ncbi:MAG: N-acetyl-gamma-glutamyl-phosphate reductase [Candidatus Handelsmanbacteria bacterium]|nr:N-acetyl-gamma-glutamyl-phosphate reductase [Candidatus Handelsmanbacteria bacterium]
MSRPRIYIDGQQGTTGLRLQQMLETRQDLDLLLIPAGERKNPQVRAEFLATADLAVLCLPDEAVAEALELAGPSRARLIDTSTARRVHPDWVYGLPEISPEQKEAIRKAPRVANCGCYPVSFILALRPLVQAGLIDPQAAYTINAVSGYSGGGRKMIEAYEQAPGPQRAADAALPLGLYNLEGSHKHLAEMHRFSLVANPPLFVPSVAHTYCGMLVSIPLPASHFAKTGATAQQVWEAWEEYYRACPFVRPVPPDQNTSHLREGKFLDLKGCNFTNRVELYAFGEPDQGLVLVGRLDNLGKGASGNAVQCLNLMLGFEETAGLVA